jgi:hypothetical protein
MDARQASRSEPDGLISPNELERRVSVHFDCALKPQLGIADTVA